MKERPILFSGPMVRAMLDGQKTQTRRIVRLRDGSLPDEDSVATWEDGRFAYFMDFSKTHPYWQPLPCPYGQPGDRLWVKENFKLVDGPDGDRPQFLYQAGMDFRDVPEDLYSEDPVYSRLIDWSAHHSGWRSKLLMPRWASRLTLEITCIRVERLQDISEEDAEAEGCSGCRRADGDPFHDTTAREEYQTLWQSLNGPGSWAANPFVWVVKFKRL